MSEDVNMKITAFSVNTCTLIVAENVCYSIYGDARFVTKINCCLIKIKNLEGVNVYNVFPVAGNRREQM